MSAEFEVPGQQKFNIMESGRQLVNRFGMAIGRVALVGGLMAGTTAVEDISLPSLAHADSIDDALNNYPEKDMPCEHPNAQGVYSASGYCLNYDWGPVHTTTYGDPSTNSERGFGYRNCTDWVAYRLNQLTGIKVDPALGNGGDWYNNVPASERSLTPKTWDAAVVPATYDAEGNETDYGHVALVESISSDGKDMTISEYNHDAMGNGDQRTIPIASSPFTEFVDFGVHPKNSPSGLDGRPIAVADHTNGEQDVFWKGSDGNLKESFYYRGWHGVYNIGMGPLGSAPTAVVRPSNGEQDVFWKGKDGNLFEASWDGKRWRGPIALGMGPLGSQPTVSAWGKEVDVFWKGQDGNLWEAWQTTPGTPWHGPVNTGMSGLASAPAVIDHPNGEQDVFWKDQAGNLRESVWGNGHWSGPYNLGMGPLGSAPTAALNPTTGEQDIFWRGADGHLWQAYWDGKQWHGPINDGMGSLDSAPSAAAYGNEVEIYWRGGDGNTWEAWGKTSKWNGPAIAVKGSSPND